MKDSIIEQTKILHVTDISSSVNQSLWVNLWGFPGFNWIHCLYSHRKSNFRNENIVIYLFLLWKKLLAQFIKNVIGFLIGFAQKGFWNKWIFKQSQTKDRWKQAIKGEKELCHLFRGSLAALTCVNINYFFNKTAVISCLLLWLVLVLIHLIRMIKHGILQINLSPLFQE